MDEDHACFREMAKRWDGPIEKPISFDRKTGNMSATWMMKLFKYTKSGGISKTGGGWLTINFCPVCGKDFRDSAEVEAGESE